MKLEKVLKLNGEAFIKALLAYEQNRFDVQFMTGSVYEQMNAEFGIFPAKKIYPCHFAGDILNPEGKHVFIGMNPGYSDAGNQAEQQYTERVGYLESSRTIFRYFKQRRGGLIPYYSNIAGFLKRLYGIEKIDWDWYQKNFINLEMIPYHSANTSGLRINNPAQFRKTYFAILLKFLEHLNPQHPVFILGFPTFEKYLSQSHFEDIISFQKNGNFWVGKIADKYNFIGLPFLTRIRGGRDVLVDGIKKLSLGATRSRATQ